MAVDLCFSCYFYGLWFSYFVQIFQKKINKYTLALQHNL